MNIKELKLMLASIPDDVEVVEKLDYEWREETRYSPTRKVERIQLYRYHTGDIGSLEAKYSTKFEAIVIK